MINTKILLSISALALTFLMIVFTVIKMSGIDSFDSNYTLSLATGRQKDRYYQLFCHQRETIDFVYPGILPNHPLYWLKMVRDQAKYYLNRDPKKRLELLMTYADKRLVSGIILIAEEEVELGLSTISKGEKYLEKAANFAINNLAEEENYDLYRKLVDKYFDHRYEIEKILISDLDEGKKQVLHRLLENNIGVFESKYSNYVTEISDDCETIELDKTEIETAENLR